jgi:hypothetical protein
LDAKLLAKLAELDDLDAPPVAPPLLTSAQFIAGFVPPDYVIDGILQRQFIYSLTGQTNTGKTAIMLLLAAHVALGRNISPSIEVEQSRVVYLAGENPVDIMMRWTAMGQYHDFDPAEIDVHFKAGTFSISETYDQLAAEVEVIGGAGLVFVDTMAAYFRGEDENSNTQAAAYARLLRSLTALPGGPCVVVACHPTKSAGNDSLQPRGGGAFMNEVDGNLTAKRDGGPIELHWQGKFRGPDFPAISFELVQTTHQDLRDSKGRLRPTVIARYLSEASRDNIAKAVIVSQLKLLRFVDKNPKASLTDCAVAMPIRPK